MTTSDKIWAAINSHVANCGGHPGLQPHELTYGAEWGQQHIQTINELVQELDELRADVARLTHELATAEDRGAGRALAAAIDAVWELRERVSEAGRPALELATGALHDLGAGEVCAVARGGDDA